jgi:hypothetical protein
MVLSPEDMQLLSRAAEEALAGIRANRATAAVPISTLTPIESLSAGKTAATEIRGPAVGAVARATEGAPSAAGSATLPRSMITVPSAAPVSRVTPAFPAITALSQAVVSAATPARSATTALSPAPATSTNKARPATTQAPVPVAPPRPTRSRASRWSPVRLLGMMGVIAVTAVALASMAHHAPQTAVPATAPASVQPATPAPASAPAPATQLATPGLAAVAHTTTVATPTPIWLSGPVSAPRPASVAMPVVTSGPTAPEPVRVKNPFDRSEVFEFPAGTSLDEARQSVADILMQRARERGIQPTPAGDGRTAKPLNRY